MKNMIGMMFFKTFMLATLFSSCMIQGTNAQELSKDFCQKYPFFSRCKSNASPKKDQAHFPQQTIKIKLKEKGPEDDFVMIEIKEKIVGNIILSAYLKERFENGLANQLLGTALGAAESIAPIPLPLGIFPIYKSHNYPTEYIAFTPDSCQGQAPVRSQQSTCSITGVDTLNLRKEVDIRKGYFTLRYTESDLIKTVTFKIQDHEAEFVDDRYLTHLCQNFPLNSRCRYWPISQKET